MPGPPVTKITVDELSPVGASDQDVPTYDAGLGVVIWQAPPAGGGGGSALTVEEADGSPTDSAVTKIIFPNGTLSISSHHATYTPAADSSKADKSLSVTATEGVQRVSGSDLSAAVQFLLDIMGLTADASPDPAADYMVTWDASASHHKKVLLSDLLSLASGGSGTVTSVDAMVPSDLSVSGVPITGSGTIAITRNSQLPNLFLASPANFSGVPAYRVIVGRDVALVSPSALLPDALQGVTLSNGNNNNISPTRVPALVTGPTGAFAITGWSSSGSVDGTLQPVVYEGSQVVTVKHQGSSSSSGNRINCPGGVDLVATGPCYLLFQYDLTNTVWNLIGYSVDLSGEQGVQRDINGRFSLDIPNLTAKASPTTSDLLAILDNASGTHKRIAIGDLPIAFGGTIVVAPGDAQDDFDGDGSTVAFTATSTPASSVGVYLNGNIQPKTAYSISGSTLTMGAAPNVGDKLTWLYFTSNPSSQTSNQEDFTGDGVTTDFVLAHVPVSGSVQVYNELLLPLTLWSLVAPKTVRFVTAPISSTRVGVTYRY